MSLGISLPLKPHLAAVALMRALGGAGSGNFGHSGRPGEVGGSGEQLRKECDEITSRGDSVDVPFEIPLLGEHRAAAKHPVTLPIHIAADTHAPRIKVSVNYAFARARQAVNINRLEKSSTITAAESLMAPAIVALKSALADVLPKALSAALQAGGEVGASGLGVRLRAAAKRPSVPGATVRMRFNPKQTEAIRWVKRHATELADDLSDTSRKAIKSALVKAFEGGGKRQLFKEVLAAVGDRDRAKLIARHESMVAVSEGNREAWSQAIDQGYLSGKEKRVWIASEVGACPICEDLDGTTAAMDGEYEGGYDGPPAHVACRCSEGLQ